MSSKKNEWLQVDLRTPMLVTGVVTQGNPWEIQWITSYKISYSNTTSRFQYINDDAGTQVVSKVLYDIQIFLCK